MIRTVIAATLLVSLTMILIGCRDSNSPFEETTRAPVYITEALVKGEYLSEGNEHVKLTFGSLLTIQNEKGLMSKQYRIEGSKIYVQMVNSSLETRSDLELIIANQGQQLFCTACAKFGLSHTWKRTH